jgi:hypothetical protein
MIAYRNYAEINYGGMREHSEGEWYMVTDVDKEIKRIRDLLGEIEKDIIFVLTEWEPMESSSRATLEAAEERIADEFRTNK